MIGSALLLALGTGCAVLLAYSTYVYLEARRELV